MQPVAAARRAAKRPQLFFCVLCKKALFAVCFQGKERKLKKVGEVKSKIAKPADCTKEKLIPCKKGLLDAPSRAFAGGNSSSIVPHRLFAHPYNC